MKIKKIILIVLFLFVIVSCKHNSESLVSRVIVKSKNGSDIEFNVYPENSLGLIANGAVTWIVDEENNVFPLDFSNDKQCFTGIINSTSEKYTVNIKSNLIKNVLSIDVPHTILKEKLIITSFTDSSGNNMLSADSCDYKSQIQLSWNNIGNEIVYGIEISTGANIIYEKSTNELSIIIPNNILQEKCTYYVKITGQKIYGDITFCKNDYYSVSETSSSSVMFYTH